MKKKYASTTACTNEMDCTSTKNCSNTVDCTSTKDCSNMVDETPMDCGDCGGNCGCKGKKK